MCCGKTQGKSTVSCESPVPFRYRWLRRRNRYRPPSVGKGGSARSRAMSEGSSPEIDAQVDCDLSRQRPLGAAPVRRSAGRRARGGCPRCLTASEALTRRSGRVCGTVVGSGGGRLTGEGLFRPSIRLSRGLREIFGLLVSDRPLDVSERLLEPSTYVLAACWSLIAASGALLARACARPCARCHVHGIKPYAH